MFKFLSVTNTEDRDKAEAIQQLIVESSPRVDFFTMMVLAVTMASFGIALDNAAIVIGSMLIAPLLYPLLALSLSFVLIDGKLFWRSIITIFKSIMLALIFSAVVGFFFAREGLLTNELLSRTEPSLEYLLVAIVSGFAASYAWLKPQLNEHLPGVAISVALIPPLSVVGIGLARLDMSIALHSFLLFIVNVIGVTAASTVVFSITGLYQYRKTANKAVEKDDAEIEKEKQQTE